MPIAVGACALPFARLGYEHLQLAAAATLLQYLPTGYLLWRPSPFPHFLTIDVLLVLLFLGLSAVVAHGRFAEAALTLTLLVVSIELPLGLLAGWFFACQRGEHIDSSTTLAPLPLCLTLLGLQWLLWLTRKSEKGFVIDLAQAWVLVAYVGTMAGPGVIVD